jgi:hypothetical protein
MKKIVLSLFIALSVNSLYAQSDSTLNEFTGRFVFPEGGIIADATVVLEGGQLSMITSVGTSVLTKSGIDSFTIVEYSGLAVFKRSAENKINGIHIDAAGYIMDGAKEEVKGIGNLYFVKPSLALNTNKSIDN